MFVTRHQKNRDYYKYFFFFIHILLCLDFGFVQCRSVRSKWIIAILTLMNYIFRAAIILLLYINDGVPIEHLGWFILVSCINLHNVIILSLNVDKSFYNLLKTLNEIHYLLTSDGKRSPFNNTMTKVIISWFVYMIVYLTVTFVHCAMFEKECPENKVQFSLILIHFSSIHAVLVICFFMLYSVYCELNDFANIVKNSNYEINYYLNIYKRILDLVGLHKKLFDQLVSCLLKTNGHCVAKTMKKHIPYTYRMYIIYSPLTTCSIDHS